ncbi:multidrug transporter AcrB (plasmid) [Fulvitalea axinellae]|uniref:Multidrug transporter AcrB n=1 Tax=Fulvitalea axinellae TaxID=1182444 RepID=A0AAU9DH09_9BACT|nr:multidrug transporter AcrB [Fulvitalea axinellae]
MNIAKYALSNKVVIHFFLVVTVLGGIWSFPKLGKLEDAPFIIKTAVITAVYPGATQYEVEELVTDLLESSIQNTRGLDYLKSESRPGRSTVWVNIKLDTPPEIMPQIWDELRRKVNDAEKQLPEGAYVVQINDDFGDVYGIYYSLTADSGFKYSELKHYAKFIRRELVTIPEAAKVALYGVQEEVINVEISQEKLASSGIHPQQIFATLRGQNKLVYTGNLETPNEEIRVTSDGTFKSIAEIENLVIEGQSEGLFKLGDIATLTRAYRYPALTEFRTNGLPAIGIGISTAEGQNTIVLGEKIRQKLEYIEEQLPVGIEIQGLYHQDKVSVDANRDFMINLVLSVGIVVAIILLAMGARAGVLIGSSLVFSILGTLLLMYFTGIQLHRTSLAAIIIAMGMLVDNAIVVADNAIIGIAKGQKKKDALINGAYTPQWGLFGATIIAVLSFMPLYLAPHSTAEIIAPLFIVLAYSLGLSWLFALTQTPLYGEFILEGPKEGSEVEDPYSKPFYVKFKRFVEGCIARKWFTMGIVVVVLVLSVFGYQSIKRSFFPNIDKAYFKVDYWLPEGYNINRTASDMKQIEDFLRTKPELRNVSISIGSSPLRYYLASTSFSLRSNFANILVETVDGESAVKLLDELEKYINENIPDATPIMFRFKVSPHPDAIIEPTIVGPDPAILRQYGDSIKAIFRAEPKVRNIRTGWGNKSMTWGPIYSQTKGQGAGVSRDLMANYLKMITTGIGVGYFREEDENIPLLLKDKDWKNFDYGNTGGLQVYNPEGKSVSLEQVIDGYDIHWENKVIRRYNRARALAIQCDPVPGVENPEIEAVVMPKINALALPDGYSIFWDGIFEDQQLSQEAIMENLPLALILMFAILIVLFNSIKKSFIIFLMLPLIIIGVVLGFLLTGLSFGFFAVLGLLGLLGMVIKNAIVLLEQADNEMKENGKSRYEAIVLAAQSRSLPVIMASGTTILGMFPLLPDPMFGSMAATIMGGLFVATLLTLIVLPVLYSIIYGLKK